MKRYGVSRYFDKIVFKEPAKAGCFEHYDYFDTVNEARAFLRKRSLDAFYAAEAAVEKARLRHNRNCKKYPPIKDVSGISNGSGK